VFALLLQGGAAAGGTATPVPGASPAVASSVPGGPDSTKRAAARARRAALQAEREVPLTPALLATAFDGPATQALITLARQSRAADDSAIRRYDDVSIERFSVWLRLGAIARERLLVRRDRAEHVRWERGLGAIVDVTGSRHALPMAPSDDEDMNEAIALPFVPGRRTLALGGERGADTAQYTDIDDVVDPLAPGAEAYYRYTGGDSATIRLPTRTGGEQVIRLREIRLHARRPVWNISVGSLWFDLASGHLVRAIYRFAAPMDVVAVAKDADPHAFADVPFWVKPMITPITATLDAVTIEYGLLNGRYWLPIARYADGNAQVTLIRARVRWEVRYQYTSVNGPDTLPRLAQFTAPIAGDHRDTSASPSGPRPDAGAMHVPAAPPRADEARTADTTKSAPRAHQAKGSVHVDMRSGAGRNAEGDSAAHAERAAQCARQSTWDRVEVHDGGAVRLYVRTPCDSIALARSPELPSSIYASEDLFDSRDAKELLSRLSSEPEPDWSPRPMEFRWGLQDGLIRYNRVEGLSVGAAVVDELGLGLSTRVEARFGEADLQPNGEAELTRTSPVGTITAGVYRRLVSANDWGDPFTIGSSLSNLLFGDDEGFYYRAWGGELRGTETDGALPFSWRLFVEREWTARVATQFSLTDAVGGAGMSARNLTADAGTLTGLSFRLRPTWGLDPRGFQGAADIRGEGAGGAYSYIRGAADLTVIHPVSQYADVALTGGGGTSAGDVPAQRFWYLGGLRTVRGIAPGQEAGDAYWMGHAELAAHTAIVRPLVFYDLGWAGDRNAWAREGRPLSGAGIGASILDGLIRLDVAHGIWPTHSVRVNAYWQGTF
jgi:hypothetical protein